MRQETIATLPLIISIKPCSTNADCRGFSLLEILVVLALAGALAAYAVAQIDGGEMAPDYAHYHTVHTMEAMREAVIGRPGIYANGEPQFSGYVADMGTLPNLVVTNASGQSVYATRFDPVTGKTVYANNIVGNPSKLSIAGDIPQPDALWTRDFNADGRPEIPSDVLWQYQDHIWAGWRGPYMDNPRSDTLLDGWGHPFIFAIGEVYSVRNPGGAEEEMIAYRCKSSYTATYTKPNAPGSGEGTKYWELLTDSQGNPLGINAREWVRPGVSLDAETADPDDLIDSSDTQDAQDYYYADALTMISYGRDGQPGGTGVDKDIILMIYPEQYTGDVAGQAGYLNRKYAENVTLYYPQFTEQQGAVKSSSLIVTSNDRVFDAVGSIGTTFHFGSALHEEEIATWECTSDEDDLRACEEAAEESGTCFDCLDTSAEWVGDWSCTIPGENWWLDAVFSMYPDGTGLEQCVSCDAPLYSAANGRNYCVAGTCKNNIGNSNHFIECRQNDGYEEEICSQYECTSDISTDDDHCTCVAGGGTTLTTDDDINYLHMRVPVGIRYLATDRTAHVISVGPGGDWVGTVGEVN
jgi:prepilin-type N-terminal cleavage/methylation domain-containing protein